MLLRSNLFSSTFHTANLLRNLVKKSRLRTSCLEDYEKTWKNQRKGAAVCCGHTYGVDTGEDRFKVLCSRTCNALPRNSLTAKEKKGWNRCPSQCSQHKKTIFPLLYSEFRIPWITEILLEVFKYTRGLQHWHDKSNISDFKFDNSPALLLATWPCFGDKE